MQRGINKRLLLFVGLFSATIAFDLVKYLVAGKPTLVNWDPVWPTLVHPIWVLTAVAFMFASVFYPKVQKTAFFIYLIIFLASLANVYLAFTTILSYWCMIFNLVLVAIFFLATPREK